MASAEKHAKSEKDPLSQTGSKQAASYGAVERDQAKSGLFVPTRSKQLQDENSGREFILVEKNHSGSWQFSRFAILLAAALLAGVSMVIYFILLGHTWSSAPSGTCPSFRGTPQFFSATTGTGWPQCPMIRSHEARAKQSSAPSSESIFLEAEGNDGDAVCKDGPDKSSCVRDESASRSEATQWCWEKSHEAFIRRNSPDESCKDITDPELCAKQRQDSCVFKNGVTGSHFSPVRITTVECCSLTPHGEDLLRKKKVENFRKEVAERRGEHQVLTGYLVGNIEAVLTNESDVVPLSQLGLAETRKTLDETIRRGNEAVDSAKHSVERAQKSPNRLSEFRKEVDDLMKKVEDETAAAVEKIRVDVDRKFKPWAEEKLKQAEAKFKELQKTYRPEELQKLELQFTNMERHVPDASWRPFLRELKNFDEIIQKHSASGKTSRTPTTQGAEHARASAQPKAPQASSSQGSSGTSTKGNIQGERKQLDAESSRSSASAGMVHRTTGMEDAVGQGSDLNLSQGVQDTSVNQEGSDPNTDVQGPGTEETGPRTKAGDIATNVGDANNNGDDLDNQGVNAKGAGGSSCCGKN
ncbi:unnamed protein product [Amoebophrya sp. A25]|nr:unnamed protein product [Amoebophrya sp. A25]|eukprot:GSA25T00026411001.1